MIAYLRSRFWGWVADASNRLSKSALRLHRHAVAKRLDARFPEAAT